MFSLGSAQGTPALACPGCWMWLFSCLMPQKCFSGLWLGQSIYHLQLSSSWFATSSFLHCSCLPPTPARTWLPPATRCPVKAQAPMQVSAMSVTSRLAWTRSTPSSETLSNRKRILSLARLFDFDLPLLGMFSGSHK